VNIDIASVEKLIAENFDRIVGLGLNVVYAFVILLVALWISGRVRNRITGLPRRNKRFDPTLTSFLGSLAKYAILALALIFILGRFGIQTTSLVALIGAAGLAIGLALQGTLSNLAAGVMLIGFRPFRVGDYISAAGQSGTVSEISLIFTEMTTPDNVQIIVPNSDIWSSSIVNYSAHDTRRCDFVFGVSYGADLNAAETVIRQAIAADPRAKDDPAPFVKVSNLGDFSVDFTVRVWCDAADYWDLKFDLTRAVKDGLDAAGVEIPFPTRTVLNAPA